MMDATRYYIISSPCTAVVKIKIYLNSVESMIF